jgi:hypothetical protein
VRGTRHDDGGRRGLAETGRDDVPWGRPAVDGIPIPPFADAATHRTYSRSLQTFVLLLDAGEPQAASRSLQTFVLLLDAGEPQAATIALAAALEAELARAATRAPRLSALALGVSLSTFFPAPWTPAALALALDGSGYGTPVRSRGGWSWGGDPDYTATRDRPGWRIERRERGSLTHATLPDDGDLVLLWMDMFRSRFPYPIAHTPAGSVPPPDRAHARRLRAPTRSRTRPPSPCPHPRRSPQPPGRPSPRTGVNVAMPYLQSWREERDRARGNGQGEPGPLR